MNDVDTEMAAVGDSIMKSLAAQLIADGTINPTGMSPSEFRRIVITEVRRLLEEDVVFGLIIDHKDTLLEQARNFAATSRTDFAIMFYATWNEHWLNDMYVWKMKRMGKPDDDAVQLIRSESIRKKTTSAWVNTFGTKLNADITEAILDIAERRNAFVHYKWQAKPEDVSYSDERAQEKKLLASAEWIVNQLTAMQNEMVFAGARHLFEDD